ncbi:MAG: HEPN domain-containing protein [Thermoplasmataceae archaeon]
MESLALKAISNSRSWYLSAEINAERNQYDIAVYSLEMAMEIAFKAFLLKFHMDVPKSHNIGNLILNKLHESKLISTENAEKLKGYVEEYYDLLRMRNVAGYSYESPTESKRMENAFNRYREIVKDSINICETIINLVPYGGN